MKHLLLFTVLLLLTTTLFAQYEHPTCNGSRYLEATYEVSEPVTVKFGENTTFGGTFQELFMDVFEPLGDEATEQRPVMLIAFGGAFIQGEREQVHFMCEHYAKKGYVTAAIDYRIYDDFPNLPDSLDMLDVVVKAVHDVRAAVRFLRHDADNGNQFRIDPDYIIAGGLSAGAIAALHHAYLDLDDTPAPQYILDAVDANGGVEGNSGSEEALAYSSDVQGVLNILGGLHKITWITEDEPIHFSMHGTEDDIVSYGVGFAGFELGGQIIGMSINGSGAIHPHFEEIGLASELITVDGGGHGDFLFDGTTTWLDSLYNSSSRFFYEHLLCPTAAVGIEENTLAPSISAYPNPTSDLLYIEMPEVAIKEMMVYDALGRVIVQYTDIAANQTIILNSQQFTTGNYFLQLQDANGKKVVKQFVVTK